MEKLLHTNNNFPIYEVHNTLQPLYCSVVQHKYVASG